MASAANTYNAESIKVLEGLDAVRKRPGMYIGSTGSRGLHHLIWEVVDNSVDEAMAGYGDKITVTISDDHEAVDGTPVDTLTVSDNGRGIPVEKHATGKSTLEVVMSTLHAGGKFDSNAYAVSGGLHGVGISVVNALSVDLVATVRRDKSEWQMGFHYTRASTLQKLGPARGTGTTISFTPDPAVFGDAIDPERGRLTFDWDTILDRLDTVVYLNPTLSITLIDKRRYMPSRRAELTHPDGVRDFVGHLAKAPVHPSIIPFSGTRDGVEVDGAIQWTASHSVVLRTFVNTIDTHEGGTHEEGFRSALTRALNTRAKVKLTGADVLEGIRVVLSVKHPDPQFEGQTKTKLGNAPVMGLVKSITYDALNVWLDAHPQETKQIVGHVSTAAEARAAAARAREKVQKKGGLALGSKPGKLARCSSRNPSDCEIYLVEGDSAGGSAKSGRDNRTQAILPLRGKVINAHKSTAARVFAHEEIGTIITALGCGVGADCDPSKLNYHKIVIMADADIDGAHIATLLMTFFWEYMRPIVEGGYVYLACPPLYRLRWKKGQQQFAYSDAERDRMLATGRKQNRSISDDGIQRYKGLGEMNAKELWETTMDPERRTMIQLTATHGEAMDDLIDTMMGDNTAARFKIITANIGLAEVVAGE